jgi:hypothetical protein
MRVSSSVPKVIQQTTTLSLFLDSLFPKTEIPCMRNCLLKEVIEGKIKGRIEVTRRRGRRRKETVIEHKICALIFFTNFV